MKAKICRDGFHLFDWEPKLGEYVEVKYTTVLQMWNEVVEIEEGMTFGDLVKILSCMDAVDHDDFFSIEEITGCNVSGYIGHEPIVPVVEDEKERLAYIEVYRTAGIDDSDIHEDGFARFECGCGCHGVYEKTHHDENANFDYDTCAIEFTPWNQLVSARLRTCPSMSLSKTKWSPYVGETKTHFEPCETKGYSTLIYDENKRDIISSEIEQLKCDFTFGEFVGALLNEVCFFNSPESRKSHVDELMGRLKEIDAEKSN